MAESCSCATWARTDGRLTNHHPHCPSFTQGRYVRIALDGGGTTYVQPERALDVLLAEIGEAEPGARWKLELVEMTQEEFDRLPEFTGH